MPSKFAALENRLSDKVDDVFGELFEFRPMIAGAGGGRGAVADTARHILTVTGVFDDGTYDSQALGNVERTASQVTLRHVTIAIDKRRFVAGQIPRQGDRFVRIDTRVVYTIAASPQDTEGRYKFRLLEHGREPV